jgi:hypothetical protein
MAQAKSRSELMQKVICPAPLRSREDDQIVELFLHVYRQGRFAKNPDWLRQDIENVEVIACAEDGTKLAIEHTRVFSFAGHREQEKVLQPLAEYLEALELPCGTEKKFWVRFSANFIGKFLNRNRARVLEELAGFIRATFPTLVPRDHPPYSFEVEIPVPNRQPSPTVRLEVEVWERNFGTRPISVNGYIPPLSSLLTMVTQAIEDKFPKLLKAPARLRFLMVELPDLSPSDVAVLEAMCNVRPEPSSWGIDAVVFARTYGLRTENCVFFSIWQLATQTWSEYLKAEITR